MGRVIKGSSASAERYTVAMPVAARARHDPDGGNADLADLSAAESLGFAAHAPPPLAAEFDAEAIAAQAQHVIDNAARSAAVLVDDARERARVLIDEATHQAEALREDARRQAHDEGYADGTRAADDELASMLETMRELLHSTRTARHELIAAAEPELVRLAVAIAERVLHQQVALDDGVVVEMAKAAIARIVDRENLTVRVNPADLDRMRGHRDELLALGDVKTMRVIEDQRVDRGGVIIETDAGSIDAKISTQLAEVRKILHIVDDIIMQPSPVVAVDVPAPLTAARAS